MTLDEIQKKVYENKVNKKFNTTDIPLEFCYIQGELGEAFDAWYKNDRQELGSELADVAIYLLGLSEILGFSLQDEIDKKMKINLGRVYQYDKDGKPVKKIGQTEEK